MNGHRILTSVLALVLTLTLAAGLSLAEEPVSSPYQGESRVGVELAALGTGFTYQGQLKQVGNPVNDTCDFQFGLWDAVSGGSQIGTTQTKTSVSVNNGLFTIPDLDFGSEAFTGDARWLAIAARCPAGSGSYTTLDPRQALTPAPYALALPGLWTQQNATSPNLIGGYSGNSVTAGVYGATIGGGGTSGEHNRVTDNFGTVGGGLLNRAGDNAGTTADSSYATIGGGYENEASSDLATVSGGGGNIASASSATVGGGYRNTASGGTATVGGGNSNTASSLNATVGGGGGNSASGTGATVGGGYFNTASGTGATVGGGYNNEASGTVATVGGGEGNTASDDYATIAGGYNNEAGERATIGGGFDNTASGPAATVGGGRSNVASNDRATVGGGYQNTASGSEATVGGGEGNQASGSEATVGGGYSNQASGAYATISGGYNITVTGFYATVGGGQENTASGWSATVSGGVGNVASGSYATVPGGYGNTAQGDYSFAAGWRAKANNQGCFVWGDYTDADVACNNNNRWVARASGGVYFYTNAGLTSGVYVAAGGNSWLAVSDRATKENFTPVDGQAILEKLAALPVQEYNLKSQDPAIRHLGPVAQDFNAAFGYGESDKAINMEDADGVALAAIQGLYQVVQEKDTQIATLKAENTAQQQQITALQQQNAAIEARLSALEQAIERGSKGAEEQRRILPISPSPVLPVSLLGGLAVAAVLVGRRRLAGGGR